MARRRPPGERAGALRGQPAPAGRRQHRPLLPAPGRPEVPIEDTVGAMAELVAGGQGPLPRAVRGHGGLDRAARPPCTRSPRCRASGRCGPATWRAAVCWPWPASTASGSCRSPRSAAASSPARSPARRTSATTTSGGTCPGSRARRSRPTCAWSTPSGSWPRRRASPPASWRWPGCRRRARTSSPSRARSGAATWRRTPGPTRSS